LKVLTCASVGVGAFLLLVYAPYAYAKYIVWQYHTFPEEVAKKLRRAVYYTNVDLKPKEAIEYYKQALQKADEIEMDPFSEEVIGIKIQVSAFYEKIHHPEGSIKVLEVLRKDCLEWLKLLGDKHWNDGKRTRILGKTVAISLKLGELYSSEHIQDREAAEQQLVWAVETILKEKQRRVAEGTKEGEGDWVSDEDFSSAMIGMAL
jgi:hypothetical protein